MLVNAWMQCKFDELETDRWVDELRQARDGIYIGFELLFLAP